MIGMHWNVRMDNGMYIGNVDGNAGIGGNVGIDNGNVGMNDDGNVAKDGTFLTSTVIV